jgi:hypothetical protein
VLIVYTKEEFDQVCIERDNAAERIKYLEKQLWSYQLAELPLEVQIRIARFDPKRVCGMGKLAAIKYVREECDTSLLTAKQAVEGWIAHDRLLYTRPGVVHAAGHCYC